MNVSCGKFSRKYIVGAAIVVAALTLYFIDPARTWWAPKCVFHMLTGWQCPGCGLSRAAHAFLHGRLAEAWAYNYFFIISLPYLFAVCAVTWIPVLRRNVRVHSFVCGPYPAIAYTVLFCIWWVVRNILGV